MSAQVISLQQSRAKKLIQQGHDAVARGQISEALHFFRQSAGQLPTAEAYTYWGWMLSFQGDFLQAIELCKKAVEIDPGFGNPYNDIGSYFIRLGRLEEAIPWLERAKKAERYEPRHFPFINLGRVFVALGKLEKALEEFRGALELNPDSPEIRKVLTEIENQLV